MTSLDTFLPLVLPMVPNAPEYAARDAIRRACIEFAEKSTILRQALDPITLLPGISAYDIECDDPDSVLHEIVEASVGTIPLLPKSAAQMAAMLGADWRTQEGQAQAFTQDRLDQITIARIPQERWPNGMVLVVALKPTRTCTVVDDYLYDHYAEGIAYGARAILHETMAQPYYNPNVAADMRGRFRVATDRAKIDINRGQSPAMLVMRPPRFF